MYSRWRERLRHTLGFRLASFYAIVFAASTVALVGLTYVLLAASLRQADRETIESTLVQFAAAYTRGGPEALAREIRTIQLAAASPGPLLSAPWIAAGRDFLACRRVARFDFSAGHAIQRRANLATPRTRCLPSRRLDLGCRLHAFHVSIAPIVASSCWRRSAGSAAWSSSHLPPASLGNALTCSALRPFPVLDTVFGIMNTAHRAGPEEGPATPGRAERPRHAML